MHQSLITALFVTDVAPSPRASTQRSACVLATLLTSLSSVPVDPYLVGKLPSQRRQWAQQLRVPAASVAVGVRGAPSPHRSGLAPSL